MDGSHDLGVESGGRSYGRLIGRDICDANVSSAIERLCLNDLCVLQSSRLKLVYSLVIRQRTEKLINSASRRTGGARPF